MPAAALQRQVSFFDCFAVIWIRAGLRHCHCLGFGYRSQRNPIDPIAPVRWYVSMHARAVRPLRRPRDHKWWRRRDHCKITKVKWSCAPTGPRESCTFRYLCVRDWLDTVFPEMKRSPALRGAVVLLAPSRA